MTRLQAMATARQMWDNGDGWRIEEIRRYLAERGHAVSWSRVKCWVDEDYAEVCRERDRDRQRRLHRDRSGTTRFLILDADARERLDLPQEPPSKLTPDLLLKLRLEDELTYRSIAAVARRFFGETMSADDVRFRLYELGAPKNPNKARAAREQHTRSAA